MAALLLTVTAGWWAATGLNPGFTETSRPVEIVDPATGLTTVDYRATFVPGVDFLGVSAAAAALLTGASFLFRNPPPPPPPR